MSEDQGPWGSKWQYLPMLLVYWFVLGREKLRNWLRGGREAR